MLLLQGVCVTEEPRASETPIFHNELQANLSNLCSRGRHYLYYTRQQTNPSPTPEGNIISIFQECSLYKHPWKDNSEQKATGAYAHKRPMDNYLPTRVKIVKQRILEKF